MKVWLDDLRPVPDDEWIHCRWPDEVIKLLETGQVTHLSLDHDLGDDERGTGYDVVKWLENHVENGGSLPLVVKVHSMNAVKVPIMRQVIEKCRRKEHARWKYK